MAILQSAYRQKLQDLAADLNGHDPNLCPIIVCGRAEGVDDAQIEKDLIAHTPDRCGDRTKNIKRALQRAHRPVPRRQSADRAPAPRKIKTDSAALPDVSMNPLAQTKSFLERLFRPEDPVVIAPGGHDQARRRSQPNTRLAEVHTCREWIERLERVGGATAYFPASKQHGVYVLVNPATGGKIADVTRPSAFLFEMDKGDLDVQHGVIHSMSLPYATLVDSGGKSLHAIIETDATTPDELKEYAQQTYELASMYDGVEVDRGNCAANRYTRLPGAARGERLQSLLATAEEPESFEAWIDRAHNRAVLAKFPRLETAGEWAEIEPPLPDPVFKGLADRGDKMVLIGGSKTMKTFVALQAATLLSSGVEVGPFLNYERRRSLRVLYLNMEIKGMNMLRRFKRMCRALRIDPREIGDRLAFANLRGYEMRPAHIMAMTRMHAADVVIADPFYKLHDGDENSAMDIKPILAAFDRITEATGALVILVHHEKKGQAGDRQAIDRGAGSGVLARDFDAALYLAPHAVEEQTLVVSTISRNYPPQAPFTIQWDDGCFIVSDLAPVEATTTTRRRADSKKEVMSDAQVIRIIESEGPFPTERLTRRLMRAGLTKDLSKETFRRLISEKSLDAFKERKFHGITWIGTPKQVAVQREKYDQLNEQDDKQSAQPAEQGKCCDPIDAATSPTGTQTALCAADLDGLGAVPTAEQTACPI